jgi:hypothetical protein
MRRSLALLIPAVLLATGCTQSPTDAARQPAVRFDGGIYYGSGNVVSSEGGNSLGSGNSVGGTNTTPVDSATSNAEGGIYYGSGN